MADITNKHLHLYKDQSHQTVVGNSYIDGQM